MDIVSTFLYTMVRIYVQNLQYLTLKLKMNMNFTPSYLLGNLIWVIFQSVLFEMLCSVPPVIQKDINLYKFCSSMRRLVDFLRHVSLTIYYCVIKSMINLIVQIFEGSEPHKRLC